MTIKAIKAVTSVFAITDASYLLLDGSTKAIVVTTTTEDPSPTIVTVHPLDVEEISENLQDLVDTSDIVNMVSFRTKVHPLVSGMPVVGLDIVSFDRHFGTRTNLGDGSLEGINLRKHS